MSSFPFASFPFYLPYPPLFMLESTLAASAVSFPSFPTQKFQAVQCLFIYMNISGYGGTDVVSLRFNGDSGANYWDRTVTLPASTTVLVDTNTASTTLARCGKPINKGRQVFAQVGNSPATKAKVIQVMNQFGTGAANTVGEATFSTGAEWVNTTDLITQLDVLTAGGLNILAGSSLMLVGWTKSPPVI